ncbi:MAG: phytanoyl-CoA dioxygenase family protein [Acidobacteriaceae bacterium]
MKYFRELQACDVTPQLLRHEVEERGYVLVRNLLPQDDVVRVLADISQVLDRGGWLLPGFDPLERVAKISAACGDPDPTFKETYQQVFNLESFHLLPHHPALRGVMKMLVGERLLVHPKPIGRLIFPNCERLTVHAHQDYRFMGGDTECFTVWIPLHDCPPSVGPLRILEGSHRFGYLPHEETNLHVPEIRHGAAGGENWVGGQINAGDVLLFHSLTIHAASPNLSAQMRLSLDCRFQDYARIFNPANLAFAGESSKSWEKTYAGWRSETLKYYWRSLPLEFRPSRVEIEQLSREAESSSLRTRYARILSQMD